MNKHFKLHTAQSVSPDLKPTISATESAFGFLPNLLAVMAESPELTKGFMQLLQISKQLTLPIELREIVILTITVENGCDYCSAQHRQIMNKLSIPSDVIQTIIEGEIVSEPKLKVLQLFTYAAMRNRGAVSYDIQQGFFDAGFTARNALEILFLIGTYTLSNFSKALTQVDIDAQFLQ